MIFNPFIPPIQEKIVTTLDSLQSHGKSSRNRLMDHAKEFEEEAKTSRLKVAKSNEQAMETLEAYNKRFMKAQYGFVTKGDLHVYV